MAESTIVVVNPPGGYRSTVTAGKHTITVDEPVSLGGTNYGANPYDLLLGALGTCMAITMRMYAKRKEWPLEEVRVPLRQDRVHAADCADCETQDVGLTRIARRVEVTGELTDEQRERILQIGERCPVKQTLLGRIEITDLQED